MNHPPIPLVIFPCNGNGRELVSLIEALNAAAPSPVYALLGFADDTPTLANTSVLGYPVLGDRGAVLSDYPQALWVAQPGSSASFRQRPALIASLGLPLERFAPPLVSPQATVGKQCQLGRNTVIYPGVRLTVDVTLGDHCLVLSNSVIGHDAVLAPYTVVASQVVIAGGVAVGEGAYIASGASLMPSITVGAGALIGMGSVVVASVADGATVFANPARVLPAMG